MSSADKQVHASPNHDHHHSSRDEEGRGGALQNTTDSEHADISARVMLWLSGLSPVENMEVMEDKEDWEDRENRENSKDTVVLQTPSCDEYKKGYADSEWLPCPPPPVLNKLLQRGEVHFRTPSGVDEKKLAIRFDISKNPKHRCIQQWDAARGRYVDLTPADWRVSVSPDTVVKAMILYMPHSSFARGDEVCVFHRDGVWLDDVIQAIYDMYDRDLSFEDLMTYASIIRTKSFRQQFNKRYETSKNSDEGYYKHIDLLQGNVFFGGLEHFAFERWWITVVENPPNELR